MAKGNSGIIIRDLGPIAAAIQRFGERLFQPPKTTIRDMPSDAWGSPLQPVAPLAPLGEEPASFQIWPGQNLIFTPRSDAEYSALDLKDMSTYPLARICIDNVKDILSSIPWEIQLRPKQGETKKQAAARAKGDKDLLALNRFFEKPDRDHDFSEWIRFVLEDMLVIDAACYSRDTEVLTKRGWLKFPDVSLSDEFATRSEDHKFEWQRASQTIVKQHCGPMIRFRARNTDLCVTPNHNMLAASGSGASYRTQKPPASQWRRSRFGHPGAERKVKYDFVSASDLSHLPNRVMPATSVWESPDIGTFILENAPSAQSCRICTHPKRTEIEAIMSAAKRARRGTCEAFGISSTSLMNHRRHWHKPGRGTRARMFQCSGDDFCAFMGMWLAEGSLHVKSNTVLVTQQAKSKGFHGFKALLDRMLSRAPRYDGHNFIFHNAPLVEYLKQFGHAHDKFVPDQIQNASSRQIRIFLDYFALGDGHFRKNKPHDLLHAAFTTCSKRIADDIQVLAQKAGLSASIRPKPAKRGGIIRGRQINGTDGFTIYMRGTERILYRRSKEELYCGPVYCVTVPNHTLYVRNNGYPSWCGNSILIRKRFNGELAEIPAIRGEMITRYVDRNGWTPLPPDPAYAQLWWGTPRVDLSTDQLVYKPRNIVPRQTISSQLYGMSPTESNALEIEIGIKRLLFVKAYYDEGSIPGALQVVPAGTPVDKIAEAMNWMNSELAGNLAKRRQWRMIQGWSDKPKEENILFPKEELLSDPFDDQHMRRIAFGYGVSPQRLMKALNRASSEQMDESAEMEGMRPYLFWMKSLMDTLIRYKLGYMEYEWIADASKEPDPVKESTVVSTYVKSGILTPNEGRERIGEEPKDVPEADELGVVTGSGFVPFALSTAKMGAENTAPGKYTVKPPQPKPIAPGAPPPNQQTNANANAGAAGKTAKTNGHVPQARSDFGFVAGAEPQRGVIVTAALDKKTVPHGTEKAAIHPGRLEPDSVLARNKIERLLNRNFRLMERKAVKHLRRRIGIATKIAKSRQYDSIQFELHDADAKAVLGIPVSDNDLAEKGREIEPHVTVLFGLQGASVEQIEAITKGIGPIEITLGGLEAFTPTQEYEPLVIRFESDQLTKLHNDLAQLPHHETHPDYKPHICVAYVKPGNAAKYVEAGNPLKGKTFVLSKLMLSKADKTAVPLEKALKLYKATIDKQTQKLLDDLAEEWLTIAEAAEGPYQDAVLAGTNLGGIQLEITDESLMAHVNEVAESWASNRAAELVGMKWVDGELVENPNAEWAISDTTRQKIQEIIRKVFDMDNPTLSDVEQAVMESGTFSESRAEMIARTEIARAQSQGNLQVWQESGMVKSVRIVLSADHEIEDECDIAAAHGPYPVNEVPPFPLHPNCFCSLVIHLLKGEVE